MSIYKQQFKTAKSAVHSGAGMASACQGTFLMPMTMHIPASHIDVSMQLANSCILLPAEQQASNDH